MMGLPIAKSGGLMLSHRRLSLFYGLPLRTPTEQKILLLFFNFCLFHFCNNMFEDVITNE